MATEAATITFWRQLLRDSGADLVTAICYLGAWLGAAWLSDSALLGLVVAIALQFFFVTPFLGAVVPRGAYGISLCLLGHAALFALLAWIASGGGQQAPDWLAVLLAQAPLVARNLGRLRQPPGAPVFLLLEALGPYLLLLPVGLVAAALTAWLPDLALHARWLHFQHAQSVDPYQLKFALMAGMSYFFIAALARVWWQRLGGDEHRRSEVSPEEIARWRRDYQRSKGR